jgi:hypothetical protein
MMQAAMKAETEYTNIRTFASKAMGGTPQAKHFKPRSMPAKPSGHVPSMALGMKVPTPPVDDTDEASFIAKDVAGPTLGLPLITEPM